MLTQGVIEPSSSPWLSPVVLVKKRDGTRRFCVDYRALNRVTTPNAYPLPRIDEMLDSLTERTWFTVLDSRSAYWAISVHPDDRQKTAFSDGHRLLQFRRLPFGLSTAPTTFQRTMNVVLASVLGRHTLAYLDDVVIASASFSEHLQHLQETLALLNDAGMKFNLEKCELVEQQVKTGWFGLKSCVLRGRWARPWLRGLTAGHGRSGYKILFMCTALFTKHYCYYSLEITDEARETTGNKETVFLLFLLLVFGKQNISDVKYVIEDTEQKPNFTEMSGSETAKLFKPHPTLNTCTGTLSLQQTAQFIPKIGQTVEKTLGYLKTIKECTPITFTLSSDESYNAPFLLNNAALQSCRNTHEGHDAASGSY
nr:uncharacterized protein LOC113827302 [Penaeus vannamei]